MKIKEPGIIQCAGACRMMKDTCNAVHFETSNNTCSLAEVKMDIFGVFFQFICLSLLVLNHSFCFEIDSFSLFCCLIFSKINSWNVCFFCLFTAFILIFKGFSNFYITRWGLRPGNTNSVKGLKVLWEAVWPCTRWFIFHKNCHLILHDADPL